MESDITAINCKKAVHKVIATTIGIFYHAKMPKETSILHQPFDATLNLQIIGSMFCS